MANEKRLDLIDRQALGIGRCNPDAFPVQNRGYCAGWNGVINLIEQAPTVDAVEVVHGRWVLKAHEENANYRWNVTAECSECHHSKGEVYAGFFPGFPKDLAREVVLDSAKIVKLDNFCPNCGAKMDGERRTDNG